MGIEGFENFPKMAVRKQEEELKLSKNISIDFQFMLHLYIQLWHFTQRLFINNIGSKVLDCQIPQNSISMCNTLPRWNVLLKINWSEILWYRLRKLKVIVIKDTTSERNNSQIHFQIILHVGWSFLHRMIYFKLHLMKENMIIRAKRLNLNCTLMIVVVQTYNPIDNAECSTDD